MKSDKCKRLRCSLIKFWIDKTSNFCHLTNDIKQPCETAEKLGKLFL